MNKYFAYLIGFFWADGFIENKYNNLGCETTLQDSLIVRKIFDQAEIPFRVSERSRPNRQPQGTIRPHSKEFTNYLLSLNFCSHREHSPEIENVIPKELISYFFLGFSDGDGCFYFNKKYGLRQFALSGRFDQDWNFISNWLDRLEVKYKVMRTKKKTSSSVVRVINRDNLRKIKDSLYPQGFEFGLQRKYNKLQECLVL